MSLLLVIDHHSGVPAYRQIMDQVKFQIASGVLTAGEELPSTRSLSTELSPASALIRIIKAIDEEIFFLTFGQPKPQYQREKPPCAPQLLTKEIYSRPVQVIRLTRQAE